ncbi:hypothetical protein [Dactylosporangium sp. CA-233914]|uniref:hypothetical protein n=1 Tax=Dactylosporangium sp. CA-233914 TaxID=3239934 RepID=UPI003D9334DB
MQALLTAVGALALAPAAGPSGAVAPDTVRPGAAVTFSVDCAEGVRSADVAGTALGLPALIPMTAQARSGAFAVTAGLPESIQEGTFNVGIGCGDGTSTVVQLVVSPAGGVATGDGTTARGPDHALAGLGGALLAIGAAGVYLLRRLRY